MTEQEELFAQADDLEASFADGAQWGSTYQSCTEDDEDEPEKETDEEKQGAKALAITSRYLYRRAYGESKLFDILGIEPLKYGTATHVLTGGDIDLLSFLKYILRYQTVDWCILSTWCINTQDILQIREWLLQGKIKKLDTYVGEKVIKIKRMQWLQLNSLYTELPDSGRLVAFKNHAKVFVGEGDKFPFIVTSSANVNTNPRLEQTVITIDRGLAQFYRNYYDQVKRNVQ